MDASLGILSSMITPAILILASGSLVTTTSQRLSRVIDRVRQISHEFMQLKPIPGDESVSKKRAILYSLLRKSARRSKLLTQALTLLYLSLGMFVLTSLIIGVVAVTHTRFTWIPTALGMIGAGFLFMSSAILIIESRLTFNVVVDEMDFVIETSKRNAPPEEEQIAKKKMWLSWFRLG